MSPTLLPRWSDTAPLAANETVEIGLVTDEPGDLVFRRRVIEHRKTGLAGRARVT